MSEVPDGSVPVLSPTLGQMADFPAFIADVALQGAAFGMVKVVPPKEWSGFTHAAPEPQGSTVVAPWRLNITGKKGCYTQASSLQPDMNLEQFKTASKDADHQLPRGGMDDFSEVERKFWKNLTFNAPLCGHPQHVDTLFSENVSRDEWNLSRWAAADWNLLSGMGDNGRDINGSKVQFSSWKSTTPLQTAPMDMYRVSYIHFGAAKTWYSIPPAEAAAVERAATEHYPDLAKRCDHPLRHCSSLLNPQLLSRTAAGLGSMKQQGSGTIVQTVQKAGEFIVLLPAAFHFGFTHGYNCSESIDIAPKAWVPAGASANVCRCHPDAMRVDAAIFNIMTQFWGHTSSAQPLPVAQDGTAGLLIHSKALEGGGGGAEDTTGSDSGLLDSATNDDAGASGRYTQALRRKKNGKKHKYGSFGSSAEDSDSDAHSDETDGPAPAQDPAPPPVPRQSQPSSATPQSVVGAAKETAVVAVTDGTKKRGAAGSGGANDGSSTATTAKRMKGGGGGGRAGSANTNGNGASVNGTAASGPKPPRAPGSNGHRVSGGSKSSNLHDVGTIVQINTAKGGHEGEVCQVTRVPVHPITWYEVSLESGVTLKLRSSAFIVLAKPGTVGPGGMASLATAMSSLPSATSLANDPSSLLTTMAATKSGPGGWMAPIGGQTKEESGSKGGVGKASSVPKNGGNAPAVTGAAAAASSKVGKEGGGVSHSNKSKRGSGTAAGAASKKAAADSSADAGPPSSLSHRRGAAVAGLPHLVTDDDCLRDDLQGHSGGDHNHQMLLQQLDDESGGDMDNAASTDAMDPMLSLNTTSAQDAIFVPLWHNPSPQTAGASPPASTVLEACLITHPSDTCMGSSLELEPMPQLTGKGGTGKGGGKGGKLQGSGKSPRSPKTEGGGVTSPRGKGAGHRGISKAGGGGSLLPKGQKGGRAKANVPALIKTETSAFLDDTMLGYDSPLDSPFEAPADATNTFSGQPPSPMALALVLEPTDEPAATAQEMTGIVDLALGPFEDSVIGNRAMRGGSITPPPTIGGPMTSHHLVTLTPGGRIASSPSEAAENNAAALPCVGMDEDRYSCDMVNEIHGNTDSIGLFRAEEDDDTAGPLMKQQQINPAVHDMNAFSWEQQPLPTQQVPATQPAPLQPAPQQPAPQQLSQQSLLQQQQQQLHLLQQQMLQPQVPQLPRSQPHHVVIPVSEIATLLPPQLAVPLASIALPSSVQVHETGGTLLPMPLVPTAAAVLGSTLQQSLMVYHALQQQSTNAKAAVAAAAAMHQKQLQMSGTAASRHSLTAALHKNPMAAATGNILGMNLTIKRQAESAAAAAAPAVVPINSALASFEEKKAANGVHLMTFGSPTPPPVKAIFETLAMDSPTTSIVPLDANEFSPHGNVKTKQTSLQAHVMAKRFAQANLEEDESSAGGAFDSPMRAGEHKFQSSTQPDGTSSDPSTD